MATITVAERVAAAQALAELDHHLWYDLASQLTCAEADTVLEFLTAFDDDFPVETFMKAHLEGDDEGDPHNETPDPQPEAGSTTTQEEGPQ